MKEFLIPLACLIPPFLLRIYLREIKTDVALAAAVMTGASAYSIPHIPIAAAVFIAAAAHFLMRWERVK